MSRVLTIAGQTFRPRKETYAVVLAREELAAREGDLRDLVNGWSARIAHANQRLQDLADADGDFDTAALEAIQAELRELRAGWRGAWNELFMFRLELIAERLDPTPDVQLLVDNWDEDDFEAARELLDERPTNRTPTE